MKAKVWLITGCSKGFGRELAKLVADKGHRVIATVRKETDVKALEDLSKGKIKGWVLDVTEAEAEKRTQKLIEESFDGQVDVLVNNAGYGSIGAIEEINDEEIKRQFSVNVFGAISMIKAVLPFMRARKTGHILNITSIAGLNGFPGIGIYNGSKFALEGIGEALSQEVEPLGIYVTNVEPGPFRTDWAGTSATYAANILTDYKETAEKNAKAIEKGSGNQIGDPLKAVQAMYMLTQLEHPPVHLPLGGPAYKRIKLKLEAFRAEIDQYEYLGLPTDYPQEA
ncbi:MAG: short-chain dehydrogenase/reductase [Flammeovirgaceae bacterium]|nr:short-chain dehydrogenase/reductase [Flammeovirgaceae bacterium]